MPAQRDYRILKSLGFLEDLAAIEKARKICPEKQTSLGYNWGINPPCKIALY